MQAALRIHTDDNVAVAVRDLAPGEEVCGVTLTQAVPNGHKLALVPIPAGRCVIKYGYPIGAATVDIEPGQWVHSHNLKTRLQGTLEYSYQPNWKPLPPSGEQLFPGYLREDGSVGVRNEVWILPTVGCVNAIGKEIARQSQRFLTPAIDSITAYTHPYGCSQLGEDHENTRKALCAMVRHPNAAAVLVLGLGCENNHLAGMQELLGPVDSRRVRFLNCQEEEDEIAAAVEIMEELCAYANGFVRQSCPVSSLVVGMKCGGSDGFSGITANPLAGDFSRRLAAAGGTAVLTEVPEMFGAETTLMNRCVDSATFAKTVELVNNFKEYFISHGQPVGENPSPGNKEGGITTLEEKSLGCVQKGADVPVTDVLGYGEPVKKKGLTLLQAPGNDLVASAALALSGAQLVLFTTGRGTPFAGPVPTLKISSNSALAGHKSAWIDFDAGPLLAGTTMEQLGGEFFEFVLKTASGDVRAKSEALDKSDLAIFKNGVTL